MFTKKALLFLSIVQVVPAIGTPSFFKRSSPLSTSKELIIHPNPHNIDLEPLSPHLTVNFLSTKHDILSQYDTEKKAINRNYKQRLRQAPRPNEAESSQALQQLNTEKNTALSSLDRELEKALQSFNDWSNLLTLLCAASVIVSVPLTQQWYHYFLPYKPFLRITAQGITAHTKFIPWKRIHSMHQSRPHVLEIVYAKPDNVRGILTLNMNHVSCTEEQLFSFFNEFMSKSPLSQLPDSHEPTHQELRQIRKKGFYKDSEKVILCESKAKPLTLIAASLAACGVLAGSIHELHRLYKN